MWVYIEDGVVAERHGAVPDAWRNISGLNVLPEAALANLGWFPVTQVAAPQYNPVTQDRVELAPVNVNGVWTQQWSVVDVSAEEAAQRLADQRAATSCTRFQARVALKRAGLLDTVDALMSQPGVDDEARLAWNHALEFKRMSPTLLAMAQQLNMTEADLDNLFAVAVTIEA